MNRSSFNSKIYKNEKLLVQSMSGNYTTKNVVVSSRNLRIIHQDLACLQEDKASQLISQLLALAVRQCTLSDKLCRWHHVCKHCQADFPT